jgi:hypothetical protein
MDSQAVMRPLLHGVILDCWRQSGTLLFSGQAGVPIFLPIVALLADQQTGMSRLQEHPLLLT